MKKTILIVCDDPARRAELAALLNANSYRALSSETGRQASAALTGNLVSLILVDCITASRLPGCGLRASRTMGALTDIDRFLPLLLLRAAEEELDARTFLMADMVLTPPVETPALLDAIETLLSESLRERAQRKSGHIALFR